MYHGEPLFSVDDGRLQVYDGGCEAGWQWGTRVDIYGFSGRMLLDELARHLKGGTAVFMDQTEGCDDILHWKVGNGVCVAVTWGM